MQRVSDGQVRKLMEEVSKHGQIGQAAMKAGMDRKTAHKYVKLGELPSSMAAVRDWRTREDPFLADWPELEALLVDAPELEAKTLFEMLVENYPGRYGLGQLRTLQRRVKRWRAECGPDKRVMLGQRHRPGEAAQTDFTRTGELEITIAGEVFVHLLCVLVLPYSNWQWATVCLSESMAALRKGLQRALFEVGRVPRFHQTDNSTAATHRIPGGKGAQAGSQKRPFNADYIALMNHFGIKPRTTVVGAKEQNGDVEASNGALKRRLKQALLLRCSSDFASVEEYQGFVDKVVRKRNGARGPRVAEDIAAMRELNVGKLSEFVETEHRVSEWSTVRVRHCAYSVPSRLIGEWVKVRLFEDKLEVWYAGTCQLACERMLGRNVHSINYRHVIWSLVRRPGGFARYVYRDEMFPTLVFRRAFDAISEKDEGIKADLKYLRILHLAASTMESEVEAALQLLLDEGATINAEAVKALTSPAPLTIAIPQLRAPLVDLNAYDVLLMGAGQ